MPKRTLTTLMTVLAMFTLALSLTSRAGAQEEHKQTLHVYYDSDVIFSGKGDDAVKCQGRVFFQVYPTSATLKKKYGEDPLASEDITVTGRKDIDLPLGSYEIHFTTRIGTEIKTCIKPFVLRADAVSEVHVDFSDAKLLVYGGDMTIQQMQDAIKLQQQQIAALQAGVVALKGTAAK